jgi:hypothetical protein
LLKRGGVSVTACKKINIVMWKNASKTTGRHSTCVNNQHVQKCRKNTTKNSKNMFEMYKAKLRQDQVRWEAHQVDELELWSSVRVRWRQRGREEFESDARACRIE